jgi:hypothetical protein
MRCLTYFTPDHNRIDILNRWPGRKQVYYNGRLVASRQRFGSVRHQFAVPERNETAVYQIRVRCNTWIQIGCDLFRNGQALLLT